MFMNRLQLNVSIEVSSRQTGRQATRQEERAIAYESKCKQLRFSDRLVQICKCMQSMYAIPFLALLWAL